MNQLPLWCDDEIAESGKEVYYNPWTMLTDGHDLAISVSGGKDSQAMMLELVEFHRSEGCTGQIYAVHADLGRAEWGMTEEVVKQQCDRLGIPLAVVKRNDGADLVDVISRRRLKLESEGRDEPFWPSSAARYCTSDLKRAVIDVWVRNQFPTGNVIVAMGLRAEESSKRAKAPVRALRKGCQSKKRTVYNWLPIKGWDLEGVWYKIGLSTTELNYIQKMVQSGGQLPTGLLRATNIHPAYLLGNHRLSCALCVLADENDLRNGAKHNPLLYKLYTRWEMETGYSFQNKRWLMALCPEYLDDDVLAWGIERGVIL